jgi:hypothetical protein
MQFFFSIYYTIRGHGQPGGADIYTNTVKKGLISKAIYKLLKINIRQKYVKLSVFIQLEDFRSELQRKEQELMQMHAKMKTVEEQHADYQKHICVLKESLIAKEEHYNMLQLDVSTCWSDLQGAVDSRRHFNKDINYFSSPLKVDELRVKLEEKNKTIEKKTGAALHATQEKNRIGNELSDLRDQIDIKDRKVNVLQRKVGEHLLFFTGSSSHLGQSLIDRFGHKKKL